MICHPEQRKTAAGRNIICSRPALSGRFPTRRLSAVATTSLQISRMDCWYNVII
jgi:hypothetical protein